MKADLLKRVERIESRALPKKENTAIYCQMVKPGFIDRPVKGWFFVYGDDRVEVFRNDGETDEELKERAATLAREQIGGRLPLLISL